MNTAPSGPFFPSAASLFRPDLLAITGGYQAVWIVAFFLVGLAAFAILPVRRA